MEAFFRKFTVFSENIIKLLLISVEVLLLFLSFFRTSIVSGYEEHTEYLVDQPLKHIIFIIFVLLMIFLLSLLFKNHSGKSYKQNILKTPDVFILLLLTLQMILSFYWIFHTQFEPLGDASILWDIAGRMHLDIFSDFQNLGYAERHFNQLGALYFLKFLVGIAGIENQFLLQIINVFALFLFQYSMYCSIKCLFGSKTAVFTAVLYVLFLPLGLYIVFTYFNLISWALLSLAFLQEILYLKNGKKRHLFFMVLSLSCSILLKSFGWIGFIAMAIYACFAGEKRRTWYTLSALMLSLFVILGAGSLMKRNVFSHTGADNLRTMPALGYVAMGMQESYMAPGWYNGIHDRTYLDYSGDRTLITEVFLGMIRDRAEVFAEDPSYAARFYYHKISSQWNNPSFQGFWFGEISTPGTELPEWITSAYTGNLRKCFDTFLNYYLSFLHFGILLWLILRFREISVHELLYGIYFLGGFLFLFFWEAKCQYTLGFFLFLLPFAASGYRSCYLSFQKINFRKGRTNE